MLNNEIKKKKYLIIFTVLFTFIFLSSEKVNCAKKEDTFQGRKLTMVRVSEVALDPSTLSPIILLQDISSDTYLPIFIGSSEALSIASQLENVSFPRPMTHDLMKNILRAAHISVKRVIVTELIEQTFYAVIILKYRGRELVIDSRPSDAIALAVRVDAPIFVSSQLMQTRGVSKSTKPL